MAGLTTFLSRTGYHEGMDVIYADELVALNALVDYLLLALAARAAGLPLRRGRFALSGLLGGGYALAAAVGPGALRTVWVKLLLSLILCALAFGTGRSARKDISMNLMEHSNRAMHSTSAIAQTNIRSTFSSLF